MNFINNWSQGVTLAAGATSLALSLPDGEYRLTLADAAGAATRWEIVGAVVSSGTADLERALEGTVDQAWTAGSVIYCSLTAGIASKMLPPSALVYIGDPGTYPVSPANTALLEVVSSTEGSIAIQIPVLDYDGVESFDFSLAGNSYGDPISLEMTGSPFGSISLNGVDSSKVGGTFETDATVVITGLNGTVSGRALVTADRVILNVTTQWQDII